MSERMVRNIRAARLHHEALELHCDDLVAIVNKKPQVSAQSDPATEEALEGAIVIAQAAEETAEAAYQTAQLTTQALQIALMECQNQNP